ncbi:MAG: DUF1579 domain-containing protein [Phycisphaeraceae bacterium]
MIRSKPFVPALIVALALAAAIGSIAIGDPAKDAKDAKPAEQPEFKLPPGWTEADMQACMLAGVPGKMHEHLKRDVGQWKGKNTMWMYPGAEPVAAESTCSIKSILDGRFIQVEWKGDLPGMGPFHGMGINGFDNVTQKFSGFWIDSMGTGVMTGTGELSKDGKTLSWSFSYNCPINRKPVAMRQVEKITGANTKTLEMFGADPKSGKEYQMLRIEMTRVKGVE